MAKDTKTVIPYDFSVGVFTRGLINLKTQLTKAENYIATTGYCETDFLSAQLASNNGAPITNYVPADLHMYSLAAQVHWTAEGAKLAIGRLLGEQPVPIKSDERSFAELHQCIDRTVAYIKEIAPSDLELALENTIMIEHPTNSISISGQQFLLNLAIPHFFYHLTTSYSILRNQGVHLTMGDFLGDWGSY
jgi:hypothetical protein